MGAVINLFPESEIVICTTVKFVIKRNAGDPVEHEIRELRLCDVSVIAGSGRNAGGINVAYVKICEVNERPADLLGHAGYCIDDDLTHEDQDDVYEPCTWTGGSVDMFRLLEQWYAPFALTQLALIFRYALRSRSSSVRPPTSSTLTMLPLRRRPLRLSAGTGTARWGSFSEGRDIKKT